MTITRRLYEYLDENYLHGNDLELGKHLFTMKDEEFTKAVGFGPLDAWLGTPPEVL